MVCPHCLPSAMWAGPAAEENPLGVQHWHCTQVPGGTEGKEGAALPSCCFLLSQRWCCAFIDGDWIRAYDDQSRGRWYFDLFLFGGIWLGSCYYFEVFQQHYWSPRMMCVCFSQLNLFSGFLQCLQCQCAVLASLPFYLYEEFANKLAIMSPSR